MVKEFSINIDPKLILFIVLCLGNKPEMGGDSNELVVQEPQIQRSHGCLLLLQPPIPLADVTSWQAFQRNHSQ
jgi:hypothetical protein